MAHRFPKDEPCNILEYIKVSQYICLHNKILLHLNFKTIIYLCFRMQDDKNQAGKDGG